MSRVKVRWSARAELQLFDIENYIALDDREAAVRWCDRLRERVKRLAGMPRSGRVVPEIGEEDIREIIVGAYRVIYQVDAKSVFVLSVLEGHQQLDDLE